MRLFATMFLMTVAAYGGELKFESLLNGKDLSQWKTPADPNCWIAHDGVLTVKSNSKRAGDILWTKESFADFVCQVEFKFGSGNIDTGIFIRNKKEQIQIGVSGSKKRDMTASPYIPGKGYPVEATGIKKLLQLDDWNTLRVRAVGGAYTTWLNGQEVMNYQSASAIEKGPIGIQLHRGRNMTISYRHLSVASLADSGKKVTSQLEKPSPKKLNVSKAAVRGKLSVELWAENPVVASPLGINFDHQGQAYVTRVRRRKRSSIDIRGKRHWVKDDLSIQSLDDRLTFYKKVVKPGDKNKDGKNDWRDLSVEKEEVLQVIDSDGDGKADTHVVLGEFGSPVTGIAAGVLWLNGVVYAAIEPDIWKITDSNGDGTFDKKDVIATGFSIHIGQGGHNMSGLAVGVDGRLYWSVGDKGINATGSDGSRVFLPNRGGVMRCEQDGSKLEAFAPGVRNGQELAFNEHGNLFTVDNDGDYPGERERFLYLIEGGEIGWRLNWQWFKMQDFAKVSGEPPYNVWMKELLFKTRWDGQAAYITPPLANYSDGPCGFAYNPGTALNEGYREHFFLSSSAGLNAFRIEPTGASFKMVGEHSVSRAKGWTGLSFGPAGSLYVCDWMRGPSERGKVWRVDDKNQVSNPARVETKTLLSAGMTKRSSRELLTLLAHADQRVRLDAQFELVHRKASDVLLNAVKQRDARLARLHGIWGIGQLGRVDKDSVTALVKYCSDADAEVRAQLAVVLGDAGAVGAADEVIALLKDPEIRVRSLAAIALGKLKVGASFAPLLSAAIVNNDKDAYLRHGIVMGLSTASVADLTAVSSHRSRSARLVALLALRRQLDLGASAFLKDSDPFIVTEAARAIHDDLSIPEALPALAEALQRQDVEGEPFLRRAINANFRVGRPEDSQRLAAYAANTAAPEAMRTTALACLALWPQPPVLDAVEGRHRVHAPRDPAVAAKALGGVAKQLAEGEAGNVMVVLARAIERLESRELLPLIHALYDGKSAPGKLRGELLKTMHKLGDPELGSYVKRALASHDKTLRAVAQKYGRYAGKSTIEIARRALASGSIEEKRAAFINLAESTEKEAEAMLGKWLETLVNGKLDPDLALDVLEAAAKRPGLKSGVTAYEARLAKNGVTGPFEPTLFGGKRESGEKLAMGHPAAQCIRCHTIKGSGGILGPDLSTIASRLSREQLLESLVDPGATLAAGFGLLIATTKKKESVSGTLVKETDTTYTLKSADGKERVLKRSDIASEERASVMPPMGAILSKAEMRDLIEYLVTLK